MNSRAHSSAVEHYLDMSRGHAKKAFAIKGFFYDLTIICVLQSTHIGRSTHDLRQLGFFGPL
jgi:hypothetical protein